MIHLVMVLVAATLPLNAVMKNSPASFHAHPLEENQTELQTSPKYPANNIKDVITLSTNSPLGSEQLNEVDLTNAVLQSIQLFATDKEHIGQKMDKPSKPLLRSSVFTKRVRRRRLYRSGKYIDVSNKEDAGIPSWTKVKSSSGHHFVPRLHKISHKLPVMPRPVSDELIAVKSNYNRHQIRKSSMKNTASPNRTDLQATIHDDIAEYNKYTKSPKDSDIKQISPVFVKSIVNPAIKIRTLKDRGSTWTAIQLKQSLEHERVKRSSILNSSKTINESISKVASDVASDTHATTPASTNSTIGTTRRGKRRRRGRRRHRRSKDLALWIDERQVRLFSGYVMEIYVIHDGRVLPYILDPNFEKHLPVIPYEVQNVNFTWRAGRKRYYYTFERLFSHDPNILKAPVVSLPPQGRIPRRPKVFTVNINCTGNASGIAAFDIGLLIQSRRGKPMPGTPLKLKLRKECTQPSVDPECDEKCENGGVCDAGQKCQCPEGYMGAYCKTALCYPQCMNGGTCTTPGRCTCPPGYQGRHCEGGICRDKCQNGGKCVQKDTCSCPRGYYGNRCEFSKCVIPCINGGRCRNVNKCRCPHGFTGDHCEIVTGNTVGASALARCTKKCRHGSCQSTDCICNEGYTGRWCRRRGRKRVWM